MPVPDQPTRRTRAVTPPAVRGGWGGGVSGVLSSADPHDLIQPGRPNHGGATRQASEVTRMTHGETR